MATPQEIESSLRGIATEHAKRRRDFWFSVGDSFNHYREVSHLSGIQAAKRLHKVSGLGARTIEHAGRVAVRVSALDRRRAAEWTVYMHLASELNPRKLNTCEEDFRRALSRVLKEVEHRNLTLSELTARRAGGREGLVSTKLFQKFLNR